MTDGAREHIETLLPSLGDIVYPDLGGKVAAVWTWLWREGGFERIDRVPWWSVVRKGDAGRSVSLVEHVNRVADCAKGLARVAAASGAEVDLDPQTFEPTEIALNAQHTIYGAHVALEEGVPWPVVHLILSHSKNTGVRPRTLEAVILHYADYAVVDIRNVIEGRDELFAEHKPKWSRR